MTSRVAWSVCLSIVCALAEPVMAQAPSERDRAEARRLLEQGNRYYEAGDYPNAIAAYRGAYDKTGAPGFLFNLAQAYRMSGGCAQALTHYEKFLQVAPNAQRRSTVESLIAEMERCVEASTESAQEPSASETVPPDPVDDAGGEPAGARGRPAATGSVAVIGAGPGERDDGDGDGSGLRLFGLLTMAGGVAVVGVGGYFAWEAGTKLDGFEGEWGPQQMRLEQEGRSAQTRSRVLLVSGGVTVVGGLALYLVGVRASRSASTLSVGASSDQTVVTFAGSF